MDRVLSSLIKNDKGSGLIVAILILAAITIIGISAVNMANVEVLLSNNDIIYKKNLYRSEAGVMEGAQNLENEDPDNMVPDITASGEVVYSPNWLNSSDTNMRNLNLWSPEKSAAGIIEDTLISIVNNKIATGSSLDLSAQSKLHEFSVFGYCKPKNGLAFVEIGYKKRL